MPITYWTCLLGSLALVALPPFAGFYSKDMIIQAAKHANIFGSGYAYICVLLGALVTAIYTFRALLMTFHGTNMEVSKAIREPGYVVTVPLVVLAIFSVLIGGLLYEPMVSGALLNKSVFINPVHTSMQVLRDDFYGVFAIIGHSITTVVFWLTIFGIVIAYLCYARMPWLLGVLSKRLSLIQTILLEKYGFDRANKSIVAVYKNCGFVFNKFIDSLLIDNIMVDGTGRMTRLIGLVMRKLQTGSISHYLTFMLLGTLIFIICLCLC
jgi:NADH-quinone oxidoreductase subunit L